MDQNQNMRTYARTLHDLADAVVNLADGLGGDEQEQKRAETIADALRRIAAGESLEAIPDVAAEWEAVEDDTERAGSAACWMAGCVALPKNPERNPYCAVHARRQDAIMRTVSRHYREKRAAKR